MYVAESDGYKVSGRKMPLYHLDHKTSCFWNAMEDITGEAMEDIRKEEKSCSDPTNNNVSHYLILARTETQSLKDGIPLLVEKGVLLLVDASLPGIVVKRGEIVLDNVVVPTSQVIGSVGEGHTFAVATLHDVRFGFDALLLGMCKATVKKASRNPLVDVSILARCSPRCCMGWSQLSTCLLQTEIRTYPIA